MTTKPPNSKPPKVSSVLKSLARRPSSRRRARRTHRARRASQAKRRHVEKHSEGCWSHDHGEVAVHAAAVVSERP